MIRILFQIHLVMVDLESSLLSLILLGLMSGKNLYLVTRRILGND